VPADWTTSSTGWRPDLTANVPVNSGRTEGTDREGESTQVRRRQHHNYVLHKHGRVEIGLGETRNANSRIEECANDHNISTNAIFEMF